jgi:hypothetical protein
MHPHGESEIVRWVLEERVAGDLHLVEEDVREKRRETERLLIRDEVHLVTTLCERDPELRRDGA